MRRALLAAVAALIVGGALAAQTADIASSGWSLVAAPTVSVPLLAGDGSSNLAFSTAWGGSLDAEYALPATLPLSLRLGAGYSVGGLSPVEGVAVPGNLSEALFSAGVGLNRKLSPALSAEAFLDAGLAYGSLSSGTNSAYAAARVGAELRMSFGSGLFGQLDADALYKAGLYGGIGATLGLGYRLPERAAQRLPARLQLLDLHSISMKSVFPILRSYYDTHAVGTAKIVNTSKDTVRDIRVSFLIKQYMDAPKDCGAIAQIEPGKSVEVPLYALFNDSILNVTEATKVSGEVVLSYGVGGAQTGSTTVLVYDRNALTWDDNCHAAAFVSNKDPWVLDLTGNIIAAVRDARNPGLPPNLQTAVAIHEGLRVYGIGYMLSTTRPFEQAVFDPQVVDTLKFPRQTLTFRAGDCADLSVLYASCLEAAGVETAFITVPGHIFMAIDLGITQAEALRRDMDPSLLIIRGDRVWVPLETTMRDAGFIDAWRTAAGEWRDALAKGTAGFYPMHDSWKVFAPMGLPADGTAVASPPHDSVAKAFIADLAAVVDLELCARIAALSADTGAGSAKDAGAGSAKSVVGGSAKELNDRGVLYGIYGRLTEAERDFQSAADRGFVPALVNLGNVAMLRSNPKSALECYEKAENQFGNNARFLVNLAKAAAALGKTDVVVKTLAKVRKLDPAAADRYAMLAQPGPEGTRAAQIEVGGVLWF